MTVELHTTTQRLIAEIERKDRRFRRAQALFMCLVVLALTALVGFGVHTYVTDQDRSAERSQAVLALEKHNDEQIAKTNRYIQSNGQTVPGVDLTPLANLSNSNANPGSAGSTEQPNQPSASAPQEEVKAPEAQREPHPPVRVLGIPVCVPLTDVCARQ